MLNQLWNDEAGLVISAELVLVLTIGVLMLVVGLHAVTKAVNQELGDLASAFGSIEQSFVYDGFVNPDGERGFHAAVAGSAFRDQQDECDCSAIFEVTPRPKLDNGTGAPENSN